MPYNNYYTPYSTSNYMGQPAFQQPQVMPQQQSIFSNEFKFMNEAEITAYIVQPNCRLYAVDKDKMIFYIKSTDGMGNSSIEKFKMEKLDLSQNSSQQVVLNTNDFIKKEDLSNFVTTNSLEEQLTSLKSEINKQFSDINKSIKIQKILDGGKDNG